MASFRDWLDPGGRLLAGRLEQLRESLEGLATRVRESVAQAVGAALGGLVRDAALRALNDLTDPAPTPAAVQRPAWPSYRQEGRLDTGWEGEERADRDDPWR